MANQPKFDMQLKLLMVGDSGVGKTCVLLRYTNDSFSPTFITTIGIDFKIKNIQLDGKRIKLQIWDTAGQERFRTITTSYFRGTQGIVMTIEVTSMPTLDSLSMWLDLIQTHADANVDIVIVANKSDCVDQRELPSTSDLSEFFNHCGIPFFEVSAKNDTNIERAFLTLATLSKNRLMNLNNDLSDNKVLPELKPFLLGNLLGWNANRREVQVCIEYYDICGKYSEDLFDSSSFPLTKLSIEKITRRVEVKLRYIFDKKADNYSPWTCPTSFQIQDKGSKGLESAIASATTKLLKPTTTSSSLPQRRFLLTYSIIFQHADWRSHWVKDTFCTSCQLCRGPFNLLKRRHHCRNCGLCMCVSCCPATQLMKVDSYDSPVRVCKPCFRRFEFDTAIKQARSYPDKFDFTIDGWKYLKAFPGLLLDDVESKQGDSGVTELLPFAEGATSFVFRGKYHGVPVAIKQYKGGYLGIKRGQKGNTAASSSLSNEFEDPLFLETSILRALSSCPYVLKLVVSSIAFDIEHPFIATELLDNCGTLYDVLSNRAVALPWMWRVLALCQIMTALCYLDKKGFAHVDLKAENCIVLSLSSHALQITAKQATTLGKEDIKAGEEDNADEEIHYLETNYPIVVKLFDFNSSDGYGKKSYEHLYGICRTSTHSPPETLIAEMNEIDLNSSYDIYSFGILMAEVASRALLYEDQSALMQSMQALERAIVRGRRPLVVPVTDASDSATFPEGYVTLIEKCWASNQATRPKPAAALKELMKILKKVEPEIKPPEIPPEINQSAYEKVIQQSESELDSTQPQAKENHETEIEIETTQRSDPDYPSAVKTAGSEPLSSYPQFIVVLREKDFQKKTLWSTIKKATTKNLAEQYESKLSGLKAFEENAINAASSLWSCSSPGGRFLKNIIYQRHPQLSRYQYYIPLQEYAERMLEEKEQEFMGILQALGARSIQLYSQEMKENDQSGKAHLGIHQTQLGIEGSTAVTSTFHRGCLRDFGARPTLPRPTFDAQREYLFYPHEPTWQGLKEARLKSFLQTTKVTFTFNSLKYVSATVIAKCTELGGGGGGLEVGGSSLKSINFSQEYMIDFFTEDDYQQSNQLKIQSYWNTSTALRFLDFIQLSSLRETFARWAITGKDLLELVKHETLFEEKYGIEMSICRQLIARIQEVIAGSSSFV